MAANIKMAVMEMKWRIYRKMAQRRRRAVQSRLFYFTIPKSRARETSTAESVNPVQFTACFSLPALEKD